MISLKLTEYKTFPKWEELRIWERKASVLINMANLRAAFFIRLGVTNKNHSPTIKMWGGKSQYERITL